MSEKITHYFNISSDIVYALFSIFHSFNKVDISKILSSQVTDFTDSGNLEKDDDGLFYYEDPYEFDGLYDEPALVVRRLRSRSCTLLRGYLKYMFKCISISIGVVA